MYLVLQNGETILHAACRLGMTDIARLLLDAGADPSVLDSQGKTPELVALAMGHAECACLFYQREIRSFKPQERNESVTTVHRHEAEGGMLRREIDNNGISIDEGRFMDYPTPPNAEAWGGEEYTFYERTEAQFSDHRNSDGRADRQGEEKGILDADRERGSMHEHFSGILATARDSIGLPKEGYQEPDLPAEIGYGQHERQDSEVPTEEGVRYEEEEQLVAWSSAENLAGEGRTLEEGHEAGVDDWGEWEWSDTEGWRARQRDDDPLQKEQVLVKGGESPSLQVDVAGEEGEYKQHETDLRAEWDAKYSFTADVFRDSFDGTLQASQTQQVTKPEGQAIEDGKEACDNNKLIERHVHFYPGEENHKGDGYGHASGEDFVVSDREGDNRALDQPWEEQQEPALGSEFDVRYYPVIDEGGTGNSNEVNGKRWSLSSNAGPLVVQHGSSEQPEVAHNDSSFDGEGEKISEGSATVSKEGSNAWSMASRTFPTVNTWISFVDTESGYIYYQNQDSGETQWEPPPNGDILIAPENTNGDATVVHS